MSFSKPGGRRLPGGLLASSGRFFLEAALSSPLEEFSFTLQEKHLITSSEGSLRSLLFPPWVSSVSGIHTGPVFSGCRRPWEEHTRITLCAVQMRTLNQRG